MRTRLTPEAGDRALKGGGKAQKRGNRTPLELADGKVSRVDGHASLGATEWYINDCALVGHERGKCLDLLKVDLVTEAHTALGRLPVVAVLRPVCLWGTENHVRDGMGGQVEGKWRSGGGLSLRKAGSAAS